MSPPRLLSPWLLLPLGLLLAVASVTTDRVRLGGYLLAGTLVAAAVLRTVLPQRTAGAIVVRSRWFDVLVLLGAAVLAAVLAKTLLI